MAKAPATKPVAKSAASDPAVEIDRLVKENKKLRQKVEQQARTLRRFGAGSGQINRS